MLHNQSPVSAAFSTSSIRSSSPRRFLTSGSRPPGRRRCELVRCPTCPSSMERPMSDNANATTTIQLASRDEALLLFGPRDAYLRMIRDTLGVRLVARGDTIQLDGDEEAVGR